MRTVNIVFAGIGGQGVLLASDMVCRLFLTRGFDVKKSEIRGMAQRGGSVVSEVRVGDKVHSPVIPEGEIDFLVAFDAREGSRFTPHVRRPDGLFALDEADLAKLPSEKVANVALVARFLGHFTAARIYDRPDLVLTKDEILELVRTSVPPKHVEMNLAAANLFLR